MPAIPSSTSTQRDFGLGLTPPASMVPVIFGRSTLGATNALEPYSDPQSLRDARGEGPGVATAVYVLEKGGGPIIFIGADATVAASNGTVTKVGSGPDITLSGDAAVDARLRIVIVTGGALGTSRFKYCCDGYAGVTDSERTYSEVLATPAGGSFAIPGLGITLTFTAGTYVVGDTYEADVECAAWNSSDLAEAFAALAASNASWRFFVGVLSKANGGASGHATIAAALQSQLATLAVGGRHRRGMLAADAGEDTAAAVVTAFASTTAARCLLSYGMVRRATSKPFPGYAFPVTHGIDVFAARAAGSLPSTDLKRVKSGSLDGLVKLFHDEHLTASQLDDNKISTLRTLPHRAGFYITQARLKSPSGSDFKLWPLGILIDIATEIVDAAMLEYIGADLRVKDDGSGQIYDADADAIEDDVARRLASALLEPLNADGKPGYLSDLRFKVSRTNNFLSTGVIITETGLLPRGYVDYITNTLGYVAELPSAAAA